MRSGLRTDLLRNSNPPRFTQADCLRMSAARKRILHWHINTPTPTSFVVLEKCTSSDYPVTKTLALCCRDAVGAVCDFVHIDNTHDLVVLPVYIVKQIIWDCFNSADGPYL